MASPRVSALRQAMGSSQPEAVGKFWAEINTHGSPLVESVPAHAGYSLVTFLWRGNAETRNVVVYGGPALFEGNSQMTHLEGSDVWYLSYWIRDDARFTYFVSPNDSREPFDSKHSAGQASHLKNLQLDPLNPRRCPGTFTPQVSYLELPAAPAQPWILPIGAPQGKFEEKSIHSAPLDNNRRLWIYTPAGFSAGEHPYPVLLLFDPKDYRSVIATKLDNLIAKAAIPSVIAVLVDHPTPADRNTELGCSPQFADFLAGELMPWLGVNCGIRAAASATVLAGSSFGGLAAACAALRHPEIFGAVLSQSGSFWWSPADDNEPEWLARKLAAVPRLPLRLFLNAGLMELDPSPMGPSQLVVNRHMRDVLRAKGYFLKYAEFNGAHEGLNWRGGLAEGLMWLMGQEHPVPAK